MNEGEKQILEDASERPLGWWPRFFLTASPIPCIALTAMLMGFFLWIFVYPAPSMIALAYPSLFFFNSILFLPILLLREAQLALGRLLNRRWNLQIDMHHSRMLFRYWSLAIFVSCWLLIYFQAPLACAFALGRSSLDRIADEALAQPEDLDRFQGRFAGIYRIGEVRIIGKTVAIYTSASEMYGFARAPGARHNQIRSSTIPDEELSTYSHFHFRDFPVEDDLHEYGVSDIEGGRISGDWFVFYSAYWSMKLGWS